MKAPPFVFNASITFPMKSLGYAGFTVAKNIDLPPKNAIGVTKSCLTPILPGIFSPAGPVVVEANGGVAPDS